MFYIVLRFSKYLFLIINKLYTEVKRCCTELLPLLSSSVHWCGRSRRHPVDYCCSCGGLLCNEEQKVSASTRYATHKVLFVCLQSHHHL